MKITPKTSGFLIAGGFAGLCVSAIIPGISPKNTAIEVLYYLTPVVLGVAAGAILEVIVKRLFR